MYKEFGFLPTIQISTWLRKLKEFGRRKVRTLFYIGYSLDNILFTAGICTFLLFFIGQEREHSL